MTEARGRRQWRWTVPTALGAVIALYVSVMSYFAPPTVLFSKQPVVEVDYALHLYQVSRANQAFFGWGKLWGYDPLVLAGQPAGLVEDLTSKGTELFVIGLAALGIHSGFAFNLFIVLVLLAMPAAAWGAARLFDLPRWTCVVVVSLWAVLWVFDSFMHWSWWIGMITWSAICYLSVLHVALLYRIIESQRTRLFVPLALLSAVIALVHPFGVLSVLPAALVMYARDFRKLPRLHHALLWASALAGGLTALLWAFPAWGLRHYIGDADTFFNPTLSYLLYDSLDLLKDPLQTGDPVRTMFRTLCFVAGGIVLWRWRKAGDRRFLPLAVLIGVGLFVAYTGGYSKLGRQTQPYRQVGPAMLAAAIPAAVLLREVFSKRALAALGRRGKLLLVVFLVLVVPRVVRTVLYYVPDALPERVLRGKRDVLSSPLVGLQESYPLGQRMHAPTPDYQAVRKFLLQHHAGRGRIVVTEWVLSEYLAASTGLPLLGGIKERNVPHVDAHLFRSPAADDLTGPGLASYFERYAVGWVVISGDHGVLDYRRDLLVPVQAVAGHRVYRTKQEPSYFMRGSGRLAEQSLNLLKVDTASGSDVVLRHHWMESLRCRPDCEVERFEVSGDRVGFIRIQNPPPSFEIYNSYRY